MGFLSKIGKAVEGGFNALTGKSAMKASTRAERERMALMKPYAEWGRGGLGRLDELGDYSDYMQGFDYEQSPYGQFQNKQLMNALAARGMSGQGTAAMKRADLIGQDYARERDYYGNQYLTDYANALNRMQTGYNAAIGQGNSLVNIGQAKADYQGGLGNMLWQGIGLAAGGLGGGTPGAMMGGNVGGAIGGNALSSAPQSLYGGNQYGLNPYSSYSLR